MTPTRFHATYPNLLSRASSHALARQAERPEPTSGVGVDRCLNNAIKNTTYYILYYYYTTTTIPSCKLLYLYAILYYTKN